MKALRESCRINYTADQYDIMLINNLGKLTKERYFFLRALEGIELAFFLPNLILVQNDLVMTEKAKLEVFSSIEIVQIKRHPKK